MPWSMATAIRMGTRGRGLGIIRENTNLTFFNDTGNAIIMLKGVDTMEMESKYASATVSPLAGGNVLVTNLQFGSQKVTISNGLAEIFESLGAMSDTSMFIDIKHVRLMSSMGWGTIFAESEKDTVKRIVLFNASEALRRSAEQMGLPRNEGPYAKINVFEGCERAMDILADSLSRALCNGDGA